MSETRLAPSDFRKPDWRNAGRVHDWKNYASDWLREVWASFSDDQARAVAASLDDVASAEDWE